MTPLEKLNRLATMVSVEQEPDRPISANVAHTITLERDFEYGWLMTIRNGHTVHIMSGWHGTAEGAIEDVWERVASLYGKQGG